MTKPAPLALFVYNRPDHAAQTLAALRENKLAAETELIVFSDGPKNASDKESVAAVRRLFDGIDGFASVTLHARETNIGLAASIIGGVTEVVEKFGRVIVIEDDLVTHPATLQYFNRMLSRYADHSGVFSVSAYSHPHDIMSIPVDYAYDVYAIPRMQCWGWATWKDRWSKADFALPDFADFNDSPTATAAYSHWIGGDSLNTLRACMRGDKDVWACRWVYTHFKHHAVCLCPTRSLVNNIGLDGSGSNCGVSDMFDQELEVQAIDDWRLPATAFVEPRIFETFMTIMDRNRQENRILTTSTTSPQVPPASVMEAKPISGLRAASAVTPRTDGGRPHLIERLAYWAVHPMKLIQRIREKYQERHIDELIANMEAEHEKLSAEASLPLVRLGTEYGGWWLPESGIGADDFVVSAGAGEDISFDLELAKRFGCEVLIVDPTPRAGVHFEATGASIGRGEPAPINNSDSEFYDGSPEDFARLTFRPWGLWNKNTTIRFFAPANPKHVSHSIGNLHQTGDGFDAECVTLAELLKREGRKKIDILKIDIEGAEFDVLNDMIRSGLRPKYVLAEFHAGQSDLERRAKPKTLRTLRHLYKHGYRLVKYRGWDYVLERQ